MKLTPYVGLDIHHNSKNAEHNDSHRFYQRYYKVCNSLYVSAYLRNLRLSPFWEYGIIMSVAIRAPTLLSRLLAHGSYIPGPDENHTHFCWESYVYP